MKLGTMLKDIGRALLSRPATQRYPAEKPIVTERYRGLLYWNPEKCTGCALCVKDCPTDALNLIVLDPKTKTFALDYHADRCIYCGQCSQNCRFDCLHFAADEWELASTDATRFAIHYGAVVSQCDENETDENEGGELEANHAKSDMAQTA